MQESNFVVHETTRPGDRTQRQRGFFLSVWQHVDKILLLMMLTRVDCLPEI